MRASCWFLCLKKLAITFGEGCKWGTTPYLHKKTVERTTLFHDQFLNNDLWLLIPVRDDDIKIMCKCSANYHKRNVSYGNIQPNHIYIYDIPKSGNKKEKQYDDVIKWKHFPRYWRFVRGIHRLPVNSPHKGQWRGTLMFSLICAWIKQEETIVRLVIWSAIASIMMSLYWIQNDESHINTGSALEG